MASSYEMIRGYHMPKPEAAGQYNDAYAYGYSAVQAAIQGLGEDYLARTSMDYEAPPGGLDPGVARPELLPDIATIQSAPAPAEGPSPLVMAGAALAAWWAYKNFVR